MNRELSHLLACAGYPHADDPDLWQRVVLLHNMGAVPRPQHQSSDFVMRGFHLLLLDRGGRPSHFAKCRSTDDPLLIRECHVLATLCADPQLQRVIPISRSANSDVLRLQLSSWLPGMTFLKAAAGLGPARWSVAAQSILEEAHLVATRAAVLLPDLLEDGPTVEPLTAARPHLVTLAEAGVSQNILESLERGLAVAPSLPRQLQHGDLWPGNVVQGRDAWWLLDFEEFGQVQVALYDVLHLLRSNPGRVGSRSRWLGDGSGGHRSEWAEASRKVLRHFTTKLGLSPEAVAGAYLYYLVQITARMHGQGMPGGFRDPYVDELGRVAADLAADNRLEALVPLR